MVEQKRDSWFEMNIHQMELFNEIPDEDLGAALKAAYCYFLGEDFEYSALSPLAMVAFAAMRPYIVEAIERDR